MALTKDKRRKYRTLAIVLLIVAIGFSYGGFYNGKVISEKNIKFIKGTVNSYKFTDMGRQRYDYMVYLNETNKSFQISATLVDYFDKAGFQNNIKPKDSIDLAYLFTPGLFVPDMNVLLSISSNNKNFLSINDSYKKLKNESTFCKYVSLISFVLVIVILIGLRNDKIKTAANMRYNQ
jgi:hypothetical protein